MDQNHEGEEAYDRRRCCVFRTTGGTLGVLSNFWPMPVAIEVNGLVFHTSEALYQAFKTTSPDEQRRIALAAGPKAAKRAGWAATMRPDWEEVKARAMRWTVEAKGLAAPREVRRAMQCSATLPIVEESGKDRIWGAVPEGRLLRGQNLLGKIWTEVRDRRRSGGTYAWDTWGADLVINGRPVDQGPEPRQGGSNR